MTEGSCYTIFPEMEFREKTKSKKKNYLVIWWNHHSDKGRWAVSSLFRRGIKKKERQRKKPSVSPHRLVDHWLRQSGAVDWVSNVFAHGYWSVGDKWGSIKRPELSRPSMEDWNKADWKPQCWPIREVNCGSISEGKPDRVFFFSLFIILFSGFELSKHFDGIR